MRRRNFFSAVLGALAPLVLKREAPTPPPARAACCQSARHPEKWKPTVRMLAPTSEIEDVPEDEVAIFERLGARRIEEPDRVYPESQLSQLGDVIVRGQTMWTPGGKKVEVALPAGRLIGTFKVRAKENSIVVDDLGRRGWWLNAGDEVAFAPDASGCWRARVIKRSIPT